MIRDDLYWFHQEILVQSALAIQAYGELVALIRKGKITHPETRPPYKELHLPIWNAVLSFLVTSANISKLLWPVAKFEDRGKRLRADLQVDDTSPFKPPRKIRDYFEHFDERLERYLRQDPKAGSVDLYIGTPEELGIEDFGQYRRVLNPETMKVMSEGETYDLTELYNAIVKLRYPAYCKTREDFGDFMKFERENNYLI